MNDFSLIEKLKILIDIIGSSPLFLFCSLLAVALLIFFIICIKKNIKINKYILISIWAILFIILVIKYNSIVIKLIDALFDYIFKFLYFPDLSAYIIILIISNIIFIFSLLSKEMKKTHKVLNISSGISLDVILILLIDIVSNNNIEIYNEINFYSNSNLLVLLELSVAIFISWILLNLLATAHYKLKRFDKIEYPKMPEIIFEDL